MKVGIINIYNFPFGMAATTRILSYSKGLLAQNVDIDIISIVPRKRSLDNYPLYGVCDGGRYYHFCRAPKCKIPIVRSFCWIYKNQLALHRALQFINKANRKVPYDAFILSFDDPFTLKQVVSFLRKKTSAKIVTIADEYPIPIRHYLKTSVPSFLLNQYKKVYRYIDARILMTNNLKEFYNSQILPKKTLILSTIVDCSRFNDLTILPQSRDYLCYMGNMELSKDNVDNIIRAFSIIKDKYINLDLYLYGAPSATTNLYLLNLITNLNLHNRVFLKGKVNSSQVPNILANAKILVASQPNTKRAEGGFPTKLGEYFMTGVPTILTDVGEITEYVQDGLNGFIVPPSNPQEYAIKISYILDNYSEAVSVAQNARTFILNNYTSDIAGKLIVSFIENL